MATLQDTLHDTYDRLFGGGHNLSTGERAASVAFGLAAAASGLRRGGGLGLLMGLAGGALAMRGASGHCALKAAMQDRRDPPRQIRESSPDLSLVDAGV